MQTGKKRPLPEIQLDYAISDVLYLLPVFFALKTELTRLGRFGWLEEECAKLGKIVSNINPRDAWKRLKNISNLDDDSKRRAVALANWREDEAKRINIPRNWVLRDSEIKRIAVANPTKVTPILIYSRKSLEIGIKGACNALCFERI